MEMDEDTIVDDIKTTIVTLTEATNGKNALNDIKHLMKYLPKIPIYEADEKIFKHMMPIVAKYLLKIFEDNLLLFDSIDDEIVSLLVKENVQLGLDYIEQIKETVYYILDKQEVELVGICDYLLQFSQCLCTLFEQYQKSVDLYKGKFESELCNMLKFSEELHMFFLKILDSTITISQTVNDNVIQSLVEILYSTCHIAEILSDMHPKLTIETWKSYTTVIQKFHVILQPLFNLKQPVKCLSSVINKNLIAIASLEKTESSSIVQIIKCSSYLLRILLKLCVTFWSSLQNVSFDVLSFLCTIYRFPIIFMDYPDDIICLMDNAIFKHVDMFLGRFIQDQTLLEIFCDKTVEDTLNIHPNGSLNLILISLKILSQSNEFVNSEATTSLIKHVFHLIISCEEFFWSSNLYTLVIFITANIRLYDIYEQVEIVLLQNILQQNPYRATLAIKIWILYLEKTNNSDLRETVMDHWLQHIEKLNFGIFSKSPELVYVTIFSQKLFSLLSEEKKTELCRKYPLNNNIHIWKWVKFKNFPNSQTYLLNNFIQVVTRQFLSLQSMSSMKDVVMLSENLELLSSINDHQSKNLNISKLLDAICNFWSHINDNMLINNIFKFICISSSKFLITFRNQLSVDQLNIITSKFKILSSTNDEFYQILVCDLLQIFVFQRLSESDEDSISSQITSLLHSQNVFVTQKVLELLRTFSTEPHKDIFVKNFIKTLTKEDQENVGEFLNRENSDELIYKILEEIKSFKHTCVNWAQVEIQPLPKRLKLDDNIMNIVPTHKKKNLQKSLVANQTFINSEYESKENKDTHEDGSNAQDVIDRLKGEVKCLFNITKTEKLTRKNCSDLRTIANQLLSMM